MSFITTVASSSLVLGWCWYVLFDIVKIRYLSEPLCHESALVTFHTTVRINIPLECYLDPHHLPVHKARPLTQHALLDIACHPDFQS